MAPLLRQRFVILCRARTGSYLLVDLLNKFNDIKCYGEVFKKQKIELPKSVRERIGLSKNSRDDFPLFFVNKLYSLTPNKITGFKLFFTHNRMAQQYLMESPQIKKVLLTRSPVDSYVSHLVARSTNEWIKRAQIKSAPDEPLTENSSPSSQIAFDPEQFESYVKKGNKFDEWCSHTEKSTKQTFYRIRYEDVAAIEPIRKLASSLGSLDNPKQLIPSLEKQIKRPLEEVVSNYPEMKRYLLAKGSR
jgi:LPS sulfotransferase NodH